MATSKKVFVGSLLEFSKPGSDELIEKFRAALPDPALAPFIHYDSSLRVFACEIDHRDNNQLNAFVAQFQGYLEYHTKAKHDLVNSPPLRPIDGTIVDDELADAIPLETKEKKLLQYEEDSSDSDGTAVPHHTTDYWRPVDGDVSILTVDVAGAIADATGCILYPEPLQKRVRLFNGDTKLARAKLLALEPVLSLLAKHRSQPAPVVDANIVGVRADGAEAAIKFVRPHPGDCNYDRIIIDSSMRPFLNRVLLSELRLREEDSFLKPSNLDLDTPSSNAMHEEGPSKVFEFVTLPSFGDVRSIEPRLTLNATSNVSDQTQQLDPPTNKLMESTKAMRVTEWSKNVEPQATPDIAPPEPEPETQQIGRRRIVADDSDSDVDEVLEVMPVVAERYSTTDTKLERVAPIRKQSSTHTKHDDLLEEMLPPDNASVADMADSVFDDPKRPASIGDKIPQKAVVTGRRLPSKQATKHSSNKFDLLGSDVHDSSSDVSSELIGQEDTEFNLIDLSSEVQSVVYSKDGIGSSGAIAECSEREKSPKAAKTFAQKAFDNKQQGNPVRNSPKNRSVRINEPAREAPRTYPFDSNIGIDHAYSVGPVPVLPRPVKEVVSPPSQHLTRTTTEERTHGRLSSQSAWRETSAKKSALIDIDNNTPVATPILPPPGFGYRALSPLRPFGPNTIDVSAELAEKNSLVPDASPSFSGDNTWSGSAVSAAPVSYLDYTPRLTVQKRNIHYLKDQAAAKLKADMTRSRLGKAGQESGSEVSMPPERIHGIDESRSRKFHQTMHQQSGRPGKGKGRGKMSGNQESKKDRDARIARAKAEAYSDKPGSAMTRPAARASPSPEKMSTRKRDIIKKNPIMASLHPEEIKRSAIEEQTNSMRAELEPLFEAARAVNGEVNFEIQFGQALIVNDGQINENSLYKPKEAHRMLSIKGARGVSVLFTDIMTANGFEIDKVLTMKGFSDAPALWNRQPIRSSTVFEFACQSLSGVSFSIAITQNGSHTVKKDKGIIGMVAVHQPAYVWDACAALENSLEWTDAPADIVNGVRQFVDGIYVPRSTTRISIYYRLPHKNAFSVRGIVVTRTGIHDCLATSHPNCKLKVTEVKTLAHTSHPSDKTLYRSHDLVYNDMVEKSRICYKIALVHDSINHVLSVENKNIEIGELTPSQTTGKSLLAHAHVFQLVELTQYVIENIDWIGGKNIGSLRRNLEEDSRKKAMIQASLPPQALTQIGASIPMPPGLLAQTTIAPSGPRSIVPGSARTVMAGAAPTMVGQVVYGVRTGTQADLYLQDGQYFYYGMGGARIPVVPSNVQGLTNLNLNVSNEPVVPADSASQTGAIARIRDARALAMQNRKPPGDDKPAGYW